MKRKLGLLLLLLTLSQSNFCQNLEGIGNYLYSSRFYNEHLSLMKNGKFLWEVKTEFLKLNSVGNWKIINDSLFLNSEPLTDILIVNESEENTSTTTFYVTDKSKDPIIYILCIISLSNDTIIYKNQFQKTTTKSKFKAFYLIDTKGLYSSTYYLKSENTNRLDILFETKRIFNNEHWIISKEFIIPRGADGTIQRYKLEKVRDE